MSSAAISRAMKYENAKWKIDISWIPQNEKYRNCKGMQTLRAISYEHAHENIKTQIEILYDNVRGRHFF